MILRIFISFLIKLFYDLPLMLLGLILIPIGLLFEQDNHMPKLFWLWDNAKYGVNGGGFWRRTNGENTSFWAKYKWLALRNPTYNSSKYLISHVSTGIQSVIGNPKVSRDGDEGWYFARDGFAWEYQYINAYQLFGSRCIKLRAGWKILNRQAGELCQFVFSFNPVIPYKKS